MYFHEIQYLRKKYDVTSTKSALTCPHAHVAFWIVASIVLQVLESFLNDHLNFFSIYNKNKIWILSSWMEKATRRNFAATAYLTFFITLFEIHYTRGHWNILVNLSKETWLNDEYQAEGEITQRKFALWQNRGCIKVDIDRRTTSGQLYWVLLSGWSYYPGELYVVLFNYICPEKNGLLKRWVLLTHVHCTMSLYINTEQKVISIFSPTFPLRLRS